MLQSLHHTDRDLNTELASKPNPPTSISPHSLTHLSLQDDADNTMIPRTILLDNLALVISLLAVFLGLESRSRNSSDVSSPRSSVARYRAIRLDVIGT
jgi:hypothetical protein